MTELRRRWLLWCSLAVAFSPIIQNLAVNIRDDPGMRYILLPILLIGLLLRRDPRSHCETRPAAGPGLLIVGLVALVVGIAGGSWGIARIGLPVAMLGMTWVTGRPAVGVILLAFVCVPVPVFVEVMTSPRVESMWGEIGAGVLSRLGAELEVSGPLLRYHGERFELLPSDSGIVTAVVLGQVSWYLSLRAGRAFGQAVARAVCWGCSPPSFNQLWSCCALRRCRSGSPL